MLTESQCEAWRNAYNAIPGVRDEFETADHFEAYLEWEGFPSIRSEFCDDFDSFLAFKKAVNRGGAKIVQGKVVRV